MKKKFIKISTAVSCLALAAVLTIPAFANTVTFTATLPPLMANTLVAIGNKDSSAPPNMKVEVDSLGNKNTSFNCVAYRHSGNLDYRQTDNTPCALGLVTTISYYDSSWTGEAHLYGWAQFFGPDPTSITGIVAFH